ncbi:hypothetical protein LCGC14_0861630, partial [marine sediment metagenome]
VDLLEWPIEDGRGTTISSFRDTEPRRFRNFDEYHNTLRMDIGAKPKAGIQTRIPILTINPINQVLTGTVTFTANSTAVTGSGTAFTTELRVGYYISPTSLTDWYRVAKVTDDTNLVLAQVVKTDDDGADTAGSTYYWYEPVYLYCSKNHYVEATQTDFLGAIKDAVAKDQWVIVVDVLGTGSMPKDMLFTIANVDGVYRITEDATITTNEATLNIDPPLKGVAADNAVVTFYGSSLTKDLEALLPDLVAARIALNWVGDTRTELDNTRIILDTANTEIDKVGARLTNAVAHITSAAGEVTDKRAAAVTELALAPAMIQTALTNLTTAATFFDVVTEGDNPAGNNISSAISQLRSAASEITIANGYLNTHSTATGYSGLAARELQAANGYISEGQGYMSEATARLRTATLQLTHTQNWAKYRLETTLQKVRRLAKPRQTNYGYSRY